MATILVAEDERDLNHLIRRHLEDEGFRVVQAYDGADAVEAVDRERPDLLVLDWMMPKLDGLEVCRRVRRSSIVPILMLTAKSEEIDRVLGLEVGADDYLDEAVRHPRAAGAGPGDAPAGRAVPRDRRPTARRRRCLPSVALTVDLGQQLSTLDGEPVDLTPKEFDLLALLVRNPGRAFARDYLLERVWGYDYGGFDRTVDTHVLRLRKKLGDHGDRIETVWGVGYRFARPTSGRMSRGPARLRWQLTLSHLVGHRRHPGQHGRGHDADRRWLAQRSRPGRPASRPTTPGSSRARSGRWSSGAGTGRPKASCFGRLSAGLVRRPDRAGAVLAEPAYRFDAIGTVTSRHRLRRGGGARWRDHGKLGARAARRSARRSAASGSRLSTRHSPASATRLA